MVLVMAFVDALGIASVMPFLAVMGNPDVIETNRWLSAVHARLGSPDPRSFLLLLGLVSFTALLLCSILRLATQYALRRWANMRRHSVSERLLARYLRQPYEFFLGRNTADLSKAMLSEVDELANQVFIPAIQLIAYSAMVVIVLGFLVFVDPRIAVSITGVIGGVYLLSYLVVKGLILRIGLERAEMNRERFLAANEVLGGIKDIKVLGGEDVWLQRFRRASAIYSKHQTTSPVLALVPKHLVEAVGFGMVLVLSTVLAASGADLGQILPVVGLYTVAGYRLLPAGQQIFASLTQLRFGWGAVVLVHADLVEGNTETSGGPPRGAQEVPYRLQSEVRFRDVWYAYPGASDFALRGVDFAIPKHGSLGIVGTTGAGKSTLLDLLLGLLTPTSGAVEADGRPIGEIGVRQWQRTIGYVPQQIYLTDASIAENIALGVPPGEIDQAVIESVAKAARLDGFVADLPAGYETAVGERGVRLSGGQRQRIGIARALYHDPDLLVLDEATNALDPETEAEVMQAIRAFRGRKTLVIVTHRHGTVTECDEVMELRSGAIQRVSVPLEARTVT